MVTIHRKFFVLALITIVAQRYCRTTEFCVWISEPRTGLLLEITEFAVLVLIDLVPVAFGNTAQLNSPIPGIFVYGVPLAEVHNQQPTMAAIQLFGRHIKSHWRVRELH
jgi:hypothetical protein